MKDGHEQRMWGVLSGGMAGLWHAQRHEDRYSTGIADVSYATGGTAEGWIELKHLNTYPSRLSKRNWDFDIDYLTVDQRNWLTQRTQHGPGRVYIVAKFNHVWLCWHWKRLGPLLGATTWAEIEDAASGIWLDVPDFVQLRAILKDHKRFPAAFGIKDVDKPTRPMVQLLRRTHKS